MAALTLHNFLKKGPSRNIYCPPDLVNYEDPRTGTVYPGQWRHDGVLQTMLPLPTPSTGHNASTEAKRSGILSKTIFSTKELSTGNGTFVCE